MKIVLTLLFCLIPLICRAEEYYVFIDKIGIVHEGEEDGHTEKGDVVGVYPCTPQYKPTRAELSRYKVIVVDLPKEERDWLTQPEYEDDRTREVILKARKRKLNLGNLSLIKQEQKVDKTLITNNIILKPSTISISP